MKNLILLFTLSFFVVSCVNKKNGSETESMPINDDWEEVEIDPTLNEDDFEDLETSSSITPTRDTIKSISSVRHIKEECDCIHFANNILYGNFQYLDMITTKEQFEEFNDDMKDYFWFGDNVEYCINAFNSGGYMGQNPNLDFKVQNNKHDIERLIAALPDCPGIPIWNELSEQFENKFDEVSKKYQ